MTLSIFKILPKEKAYFQAEKAILKWNIDFIGVFYRVLVVKLINLLKYLDRLEFKTASLKY
jgi:hypothetical protein